MGLFYPAYEGPAFGPLLSFARRETIALALLHTFSMRFPARPRIGVFGNAYSFCLGDLALCAAAHLVCGVRASPSSFACEIKGGAC